MADHYEELPDGMGFPTIADVRKWQALFEKAVPGGNNAELIGFKFADAHVLGICRNKDGSYAKRTKRTEAPADVIGNADAR